MRGSRLMVMRMEGFPPCQRIPDAAKMLIVINQFQALANDFLVQRENGLFLGHGCALACLELQVGHSVRLFERHKEASSARHLSNIFG